MAAVKRYKRENDFSYALGITLTFELLAARPKQARRVFVHSQMQKGDTLDRLTTLCRQADVEMVYSDKVFSVLSQKENCYVIGEFAKFFDRLLPKENHIVLVNPSNAGNLGTVMRSALGFGFPQVAVILPAADVFDPKTVRASMGAVFSLHLSLFDSFTAYTESAGQRQMYPFLLTAKVPLADIRPQGAYSLIFGNEAAGLPKEFEQIGTGVVIPHTDKIDSLNLPIAASIAMYETTKNGGLELFLRKSS